MKRTTIILLLISFNFLSNGQIPNMTRQKTVDSLFTLLPGIEGTVKVDVLNQLALNLAPRSYDSSFRYATEALRLSEKLNYPQGKGIATFNIGNSYYFNADIKNALTNYLTALRIFEPFEPSKEVGNLLLQLGAVNQYVRNTDKVTAYYKRAVSNFAVIGDSISTMGAYVTLASSYFYKLQTLESIGSQLPTATVNAMMDSALLYNGKVLDYRTRHPDSTWMPDLYNFQGLYYQAKNDSSALDYYLKSLEACNKFADTNSRNIMEGLLHGNLGYYYYAILKDRELGYSHILLGADLQKKTDRFDLYGRGLLSLGDVEIDRGNYHRARQYLFRGMNMIDTFLVKIGQIVHEDPAFRIWGVTQARSGRIDGLKILVRLYELTGDYKQALEVQKKIEEEKSIQSLDELTRQIIGMEANNEDQLKRQEIAGLVRDNELRRLKMNQTRILFIGLGSAALIAFLVIVIWIQRKRFRADQKSLVLEQKLLRSQMNPHFIFNSLASIQNFIVTEQPDKASLYLSKFARLIRNILDNSVEEYVALDKEISTIENYLELQKVRYSGKFAYRVNVSDDIDTETMMIPPMLAQPFIENAIEHGIKHRETPGHIDIRFSLKDHTLIFEVEDDGIGRQKAREIRILKDPEHKSMATSLTRERLANLNRKLNEKIRLEIFDLKNALGEATGTRVTFGIPVGR